MEVPWYFPPKPTSDDLRSTVPLWLTLRSRLEKFARSRIARLGLATTLIGVGAWSFLPYVAYKVAPTAFVNAELVRITAPINGQLTKDLPRKGDLTDPLIKTKLIQSLTIDRSRLIGLEQQYEDAKAKTNLAASQISELAAADRAFTQRIELYQTELKNRLDLEIREIQAALKACRDEQDVNRSALNRAEQMEQKQLLSTMQLEVVKGDYFKVVQTCQGISGTGERLKAERDATTKGTFVQDGSGAPFSEQERGSLLLSRQERERELLDARSKMEQHQAEISEVRMNVESLAHYDMNLPGGFIVWSVLASPGSAVIEGQTIMELADCRNPFVVVQFPERELASISVGDVAAIRLVGENEWTSGKVRRVRGSAARSDEMLLAAAVPDPKDHDIVVDISMLEDARPMEVSRGCNIGRLAEVRLDRHAFALVSWLLKPWNNAVGTAESTEAVVPRAVAAE
jgi:multidrug resistance efflux pump